MDDGYSRINAALGGVSNFGFSAVELALGEAILPGPGGPIIVFAADITGLNDGLAKGAADIHNAPRNAKDFIDQGWQIYLTPTLPHPNHPIIDIKF